jgi:hypothetical protein
MSLAGVVSHACRNPMCPKASTKQYKSERAALVLHMTQFPQCEVFSGSMLSDGTGGWESSNRHTTTALKPSVDLRRDYLNPYDHHLYGSNGPLAGTDSALTSIPPLEARKMRGHTLVLQHCCASGWTCHQQMNCSPRHHQAM